MSNYYQVAWEFQRRRLSKIDESRKSYKDIMDAFRECLRKVEYELNLLREFGVHPLVDLETKIKSVIDSLSTSISGLESSYNSVPTSDHYDSIFNRITTLYDGKIGISPSDKDLEIIFSEGSSRYSQKIPPGFKDEKSKQNNPKRELYGDLLIWKEIIDKALSEKKGVIFITEDIKEDWWERSVDGKTIGPLPALKREFSQNTNQLFHMYRAGVFAERAANVYNMKIDANSAEEIKREISGDLKSINDEANLSFDDMLLIMGNTFTDSAYGAINKKLYTKYLKKDTVTKNEIELLKSNLVKKYMGIDEKKHEINSLEIIKLNKNIIELEFRIKERLNSNGFDYDDSDVQRWGRERDFIKKIISEI